MKFSLRFLAVVLMLSACLSFVGCSNTPEIPLTPNTTAPQSTTPASTAAPIPLGNKVGDRCYSYDVPLVNGEGDTGKTLDPATTGKVTVINFWGTWCNPCIMELPHFDQFARDYAEKVTVVAIHSVGDSRNLSKFLAENYPDPAIIFGRDVGDDFNGEYYTMTGGTSYYPYTLVLDAQGVIRHIQTGAMSYEELKAIIVGFDPSFA